MNKLSSDSTFFYKRFFIIFWFSIIGLLILFFSLTTGQNNGYWIIFIILGIIIAIIGYFIFNMMMPDLIHPVYDEGTSILFVDNDKKVRINLSEIKAIDFSFSFLPIVTVYINHQTEFGKELTFTPSSTSVVPYKLGRDTKNLINRVNEAKRG